ncbi:hypothetical protein ISCGN_002790 [Ixodes scapularis]
MFKECAEDRRRDRRSNSTQWTQNKHSDSSFGARYFSKIAWVPQKAAPTTSPLIASSTPSPARELHYVCSQYKRVALQALTTSMSSLLCCRGKFKGHEVHHCHYSALLEYEEQQAGLRALPKLTRAHIFPNAFQKMSVRLTVQLFSKSTASAMEFYSKQEGCQKLHNSTATFDFTKQMNNLFDCLNSRRPQDVQYNEAGHIATLKANMKWLEDCCTNIESLPKQTQVFFLSKPTCGALRITLHSTVALIDRLLKSGFRYLLVGNLGQDPLEDVLLQIKEDILDRISCTTTRAVLALDIKGAFDNVSHTLVFENLASTGCGPWMYDYVRDFLSNWMATIGIESIRTSTIPIPSKGNRQGSVLSPTFGRQDFLEEVIETVQNYLEAGNLQRAPDKSQLLLLRAGKPIPEEEEGGHPPHRDGGAKYTVDRLVKTTTQVMRMVRRITSHRHGLEESDLIRLTQPLVVSHIACANPYLNLLSRGKGKMDVIIRKGY